MHYCYVHTIHTPVVCTCVKGYRKYLIASHRGRRVFNTSLLSSTELLCTLMRSASVLPVSAMMMAIYQVIPEESMLCQGFVGTERETSDAASGSNIHRTNPHRFSGKYYHPWLKLPLWLR